MHYVYILHSDKLNRYYTGYTSDINTRLEFHENSDSRKFTYNADDWVLVFSLECENKTQALAIEKHIKLMKSKTYIQNLLIYPEMVTRLKEKYKP
ncbi:excinuclease ABC subunit C [Flavobacterium rivuli WB 3.3-2 = DSM 21788]|uniref:Excinuclease ABC subunit C n=1 Tax=Flavobacterium rivuli WB 3.3-2 = DSM 21788 TaxID=1121895 RepID=A0A0A2MAK9_9FLAO|nr:GIY-YIG nuclease family protein [Flavobacterium rivuli]KGO85330.1 excinuclease ABC subunit C [Flavobacterium rivuli WB 3.3-2 = DSM 21788]